MQAQYVPVAQPPMSESEAREFVTWARTTQDQLVQRVYEAYNRQAHLALGYASWADMCDGEGLGFYRLPADKRKPAVIELRTLGMSQRSIGQALGVGKDTVARDAGERSNGGANAPFVSTEPVLEGTVVDEEVTPGVTLPEEVRSALKLARHHLRKARATLSHYPETHELRTQLLDALGTLNNLLAGAHSEQ